jgi:transcriptional regulator with XRE-family HTH domain
MTNDALRRMIASWRRRYGWSQEAVAAGIGMKQSQYSDYETGRRPVSLDLLRGLATLYGRELTVEFTLKEWADA